MLVDGGIRENVPWKGLQEIGAEKIITVTFEKQIQRKSKINIIDVIQNSIDIMGYELSNYELRGVDNVIKIKIKNIKLLQTEKIEELYREGYTQAKKQLRNHIINNKWKTNI